MVFTTEGFSEVAIECWSEYELNPRPVSSVQLALRANFAQLLQFHLVVQCSRFISVFVFVSRHICIKQSLAQVIMLVVE